MADGKAKKVAYMAKLKDLMESYPHIILVICDNVGSHHMQKIRASLRGKAIILMGKNTLMRKTIKDNLEKHPEWEQLLPCIKGNVGLVFTHEDLIPIKDKLLESRVPAQAKAGILAPQDVLLPKHITNLEPTKTTFFAALDIATKITKGCVEIMTDVRLCKEGERVGSSEAALMAMLDIRPFTYGLKLTHVYDEGFVFPATLLSYTPADLFQQFAIGVSNVAALSLAISYPSLPAFPHVVADAFKNLVAVAIGTNYVFEQAKTLKEMAENPDAFKSTAVATSTDNTSKPVEEEPEEEAQESSEPEGFESFW